MLTVTTINDLISITNPSLTPNVQVLGYNNPNDGGGGFFYYDATSTATHNDGTIFSASGTGMWIRLYSGAINVRWFNVMPNVSYCTSQMQNAINFAAISGGKVFVPSGEYFFDDTIILKDNVTLEGECPTHISQYKQHPLKKGSVLLFELAENGKSCIKFEEFKFKIALKNISVYAHTNYEVNAVIEIKGVAYPLLDNVEISSTNINTGTGLLLKPYVDNSTPPNFLETLYGVFNAVDVSAFDITGSNKGCSLHVGLRIIGEYYNTNSPAVNNAHCFSGCHFIARKYPLLVDQIADPIPFNEIKNQSITFLGCSFESFYYDGYASLIAPEVIEKSHLLHGMRESGTWVVFKWIKIDSVRAMSFQGCYFELQNLPIIINGYSAPVFCAIHLGTKSVSTSFDNCRLITAIYDEGVANTATSLPNGVPYYRQEKARLILTKTVAQTITPYGWNALQFDNPPSSEDLIRNVIDFNVNEVTFKERGTYYIHVIVTFPIDFPSGGIEFCIIRINFNNGVRYYKGQTNYGSGSTTDSISAEASCMITINEGETIKCEILQNTGVNKTTLAAPEVNYLNIIKI